MVYFVGNVAIRDDVIGHWKSLGELETSWFFAFLGYWIGQERGGGVGERTKEREVEGEEAR